MATNYDEVISELRAEEKRLESELAQIRAAIPAMILLRNRAKASAKDADLAHLPGWQAPGMRFAGIGATKAIPEILKSAPFQMTSSEILDVLKSGGWTTDSKKPIGTVSATLTALEDKGIIERVGEGWRLRILLSPEEAFGEWPNAPPLPSPQ